MLSVASNHLSRIKNVVYRGCERYLYVLIFSEAYFYELLLNFTFVI